MRFKGKVAIVTGGAGGIGQGYAKALAKEGAHVVVADIDEAPGKAVVKSINADGGSALFTHTDISSVEQVGAMTDAVVREFGRIDYLINNAALFAHMKLDPLLQIDLDYYYRFMNVNLHGSLITTRAVLPYMKKQGGAIVNQTSTAAQMSIGMYSVAKYALNGLTFALARELGPLNIRINAIAPGPTDTPALFTNATREQLQGLLATMPIARLGQPDDLAGAVLFLLSDEARWVTGHVMHVDGGQWMRT